MSFAAQGKFQPVDQVVVDEEFPACSRLLNCTRSAASLHNVAEEKGEVFLQPKWPDFRAALIALFKHCVLRIQRWEN